MIQIDAGERGKDQVGVGDVAEGHLIFVNGILWDVKISQRKSSMAQN